MTQTEDGPLTGVRVVELASVLMAPYAAQILGDLGADVVKVEGERIDSGRVMGGGPHDELSGVAMNLLRNKRSIQLDLRHEAARQAMLRLLATADVFVTNLRPHALESLGLSHEVIGPAFPRLVFCEAHGFPSDSGEAERPAFDDVIQAETGLPKLSEHIGNGVAFMPTVLADKVTGLYVAQAVLGALLSRAKTGRGQRVEVSMFHAVLGFNLIEHLAQAAFPRGQTGYMRILNPHRGPHRTADGYVAMLPYSQRDWQELYAAVGRSHELQQFPFNSQRDRHAHAAEVYASLAKIISERTTGEWIELCTKLGIAVAPVSSLDEVVADPALHRGALQLASHPVVGPYRQICPPVRYSDSPMSVRRHAPLIGEQTVEILAEIGLPPEEIRQLLDSGAARQSGEHDHDD
jgi:crotonobetainyl-CoA:carnitine CoA-transferase CaiB-like acyl-CoA transferase